MYWSSDPKCRKCGKSVEVGVDAVWIKGKAICDKCGDIKRDQFGNAWNQEDRKFGRWIDRGDGMAFFCELEHGQCVVKDYKEVERWV
jgi:hypothetical protein